MAATTDRCRRPRLYTPIRTIKCRIVFSLFAKRFDRPALHGIWLPLSIPVFTTTFVLIFKGARNVTEREDLSDRYRRIDSDLNGSNWIFFDVLSSYLFTRVCMSESSRTCISLGQRNCWSAHRAAKRVVHELYSGDRQSCLFYFPCVRLKRILQTTFLIDRKIKPNR